MPIGGRGGGCRSTTRPAAAGAAEDVVVEGSVTIARVEMRGTRRKAAPQRPPFRVSRFGNTRATDQPTLGRPQLQRLGPHRVQYGQVARLVEHVSEHEVVCWGACGRSPRRKKRGEESKCVFVVSFLSHPSPKSNGPTAAPSTRRDHLQTLTHTALSLSHDHHCLPPPARGAAPRRGRRGAGRGQRGDGGWRCDQCVTGVWPSAGRGWMETREGGGWGGGRR